jgi:chemotaxis protein methyltransferase CheR
VRGQLFYEVDGGQWNIPEELLRAISNGQAIVEDYEADCEFRGSGRRVMLLNARKVFYQEGAHSTLLLAFEDITDRRAMSEKSRSCCARRRCCCKRCNIAPPTVCRSSPVSCS